MATISYLEVWTLPKNGKVTSPPSDKHKQKANIVYFLQLLHVTQPSFTLITLEDFLVRLPLTLKA